MQYQKILLTLSILFSMSCVANDQQIDIERLSTTVKVVTSPNAKTLKWIQKLPVFRHFR